MPQSSSVTNHTSPQLRFTLSLIDTLQSYHIERKVVVGFDLKNLFSFEDQIVLSNLKFITTLGHPLPKDPFWCESEKLVLRKRSLYSEIAPECFAVTPVLANLTMDSFAFGKALEQRFKDTLIDPILQEVIRRCTQEDPSKRPTLAEVGCYLYVSETLSEANTKQFNLMGIKHKNKIRKMEKTLRERLEKLSESYDKLAQRGWIFSIPRKDLDAWIVSKNETLKRSFEKRMQHKILVRTKKIVSLLENFTPNFDSCSNMDEFIVRVEALEKRLNKYQDVLSRLEKYEKLANIHSDALMEAKEVLRRTVLMVQYQASLANSHILLMSFQSLEGNSVLTQSGLSMFKPSPQEFPRPRVSDCNHSSEEEEVSFSEEKNIFTKQSNSLTPPTITQVQTLQTNTDKVFQAAMKKLDSIFPNEKGDRYANMLFLMKAVQEAIRQSLMNLSTVYLPSDEVRKRCYDKCERHFNKGLALVYQSEAKKTPDDKHELCMNLLDQIYVDTMIHLYPLVVNPNEQATHQNIYEEVLCQTQKALGPVNNHLKMLKRNGPGPVKGFIEQFIKDMKSEMIALKNDFKGRQQDKALLQFKKNVMNRATKMQLSILAMTNTKNPQHSLQNHYVVFSIFKRSIALLKPHRPELTLRMNPNAQEFTQQTEHAFST